MMMCTYVMEGEDNDKVKSNLLNNRTNTTGVLLRVQHFSEIRKG